MEKKKYIVTVYGVLKFSNGKKVETGGFIPSDISDEEIKEKLKRNLISVFDDKISAMVQTANLSQVDIVKQLQNENKLLKKENDALKMKIDSFENDENDVLILSETNEQLRKEIEALKKAAKK